MQRGRVFKIMKFRIQNLKNHNFVLIELCKKDTIFKKFESATSDMLVSIEVS